MPLSIPWTWTQTETHLTVTCSIPLSCGILQSSGLTRLLNDSLIVSSVCIKLNLQPALLLLDLLHPIAFEHTEWTARLCSEQQNDLILTLKKQTPHPQQWSSLTFKPQSKIELLTRRQQSFDEYEKYQSAMYAQHKLDAQQTQQQLNDTRWRAGRESIEILHRLKGQQRVVAMDELKKWSEQDNSKKADATTAITAGTASKKQQSKQAPVVTKSGSIIELIDDEEDNENDSSVKSKLNKTQSAQSPLNADTKTQVKPSSVIKSVPLSAAAQRNLPPVRVACAPVRVRFTRVAPQSATDPIAERSTPARTKVEDIDRVLQEKMKQHHNRQITSTAAVSTTSESSTAPTKTDDARSIQERLPVFLKDKADACLQACDYSAAHSAYTHCITQLQRQIAQTQNNKSRDSNATTPQQATKVTTTQSSIDASSHLSQDQLLLIKCWSNRALSLFLHSQRRTSEQVIIASRQRMQQCIADCCSALQLLHEDKSDQPIDLLLLGCKLSSRQVQCHTLLGEYELACVALEQYSKQAQKLHNSAAASSSIESDKNKQQMQQHSVESIQTQRASLMALLQQRAAQQHCAYKQQGDAALQQLQQGGIDASSTMLRNALQYYSLALSIQPTFVECSANRLIALLRLHEWQQVIFDSVATLALIQEQRCSNQSDKVAMQKLDLLQCKVLQRKAHAHTELGQHSAALTTLRAARQLSLEQFTAVLEDLIQSAQKRQSIAQQLHQCTTMMSKQAYNAALQGYAHLLTQLNAAMPSSSPANDDYDSLQVLRVCEVLIDRAAAQLQLHNLAASVVDSTRALTMCRHWLEQRRATVAESSSSELAIVKRCNRLCLLALVRRGTAYAYQGVFEQAEKDYVEAISLCDGEQRASLQSDLASIQAQLNSTTTEANSSLLAASPAAVAVT